MFKEVEVPGTDEKPWRALLLLGPTGSGKTPLGLLLEKKGYRGSRCLHFDFGAHLRRIAADIYGSPRFEESELETIRRSLTTGALLDNRDFGLALKIFRMFVENRGLNRADIIALNGFPRHVGQAEGLEGIVNIEKVVFLDGSDEVIKERLRLDTGGDRESRSDGAETVARRLSIFRERTLTLLTYYQNREVPVVRIAVEARMSAEEMSNRLIS